MKRILLATDGSEYALSASAYLANVYKGTSDVEITVLHISPPVPPIYREERHDPQTRKAYAAWRKKKEQEAKKYIGECVEVLQKGGFKRNTIKAKHAHQIVGVARDILREADARHSDACVIGKKGMGWFDDMFLGSITSKLVDISENHPIWLVSGNKWDSQKVFVAMDHTAQTIQLARYVGEMFQGLEGVKILFYHYCASFTEDLTPEEREKMKEIEKHMIENERDRMSHFFSEACKVLEGLGFDRKSVEYEFDHGNYASTRKVAQRVLKKVKEGKHGTLVIGRKGATSAREFRLGSVAWRIATESENCAVWVV
jgi:nucleotide-binding universal stress UspA family protein